MTVWPGASFCKPTSVIGEEKKEESCFVISLINDNHLFFSLTSGGTVSYIWRPPSAVCAVLLLLLLLLMQLMVMLLVMWSDEDAGPRCLSALQLSSDCLVSDNVLIMCSLLFPAFGFVVLSSVVKCIVKCTYKPHK